MVSQCLGRISDPAIVALGKLYWINYFTSVVGHTFYEDQQIDPLLLLSPASQVCLGSGLERGGAHSTEGAGNQRPRRLGLLWRVW